MSGKKPERSGRFRFADFLIILVFFSIGGLFIYMLADDLMPVINFQESVFFDRLVTEAPPAMYIPPEVPEINSDPIVEKPPPPPVAVPVSPSPSVVTARPPASSMPAAAVAPSLPQLLPFPRNLQPNAGTNFSLEELRSGKKIVFSWQAVQGANAYIFYLYRQTESKQQIIRTNIVYTPQYTMVNTGVLDRGIFIWRVEAVYIGRSNRIERSGRQGESSFIVN